MTEHKVIESVSTQHTNLDENRLDHTITNLSTFKIYKQHPQPSNYNNIVSG